MSLNERIHLVEERVRNACMRCGRNREDVRVIAVTKYTSLETTRRAVKLGLRDLGESRWQDAKPKRDALGDQPTWHFIGHLQTNKVKDIIGSFAYIHSLDRPALAEELQRRASASGITVAAFIQLNISGESTKYGLAPSALNDFAELLRNMPNIRVAGLMTMAPHEAEAEATRPIFRRLRELRDELNARRLLEYPIDGLSMGMTNDFAVAIEEGATWIRLGSVLFGNETT